MLKLLLKKQAQEWASFLYLSAAVGRRRSRAAIIGYAALLLYATAAFGAMFWLLSDTLCAALEPAGLSWLYFALMGTLALLLGLIGSVLMTYPTLYAARDNEFLLSLPIPPGTILLARMTGLYLLTLFFQVLVLLPAGIVYARYAGLTAGGAASWLVALGLLTLLTLALACAVGWLIALAAGHVRHRSLVTVLLSTVFIVAYFALCMRLNRSLALLMEHLDLLARYFAGWLRPLGLIGRALSGDGAALFVFAALSLALSALVYAALSHSFFALAAGRRAAPRANARIRQTRAATEDAALLRRELTHLGRSAVYLLNCTMGGILLLTGSVYALLRRDVLAAILAQNPELRAELLPLTAGIILLLCAMGIVTAPSVSLEGRSLWIVQSLPVEPWQVLRAKLRLHLLCVGAPALVSAVLLAAALRLGAVQAVLLMLLTLAFVFFGAQTGLLWGLRLPNLTWTNETAPIKQGAATALALLTGWVAVLLLAGGYILLHGRLAPEGILALAAALLTIVNVLLRRRLQTVGAARFASLQP